MSGPGPQDLLELIDALLVNIRHGADSRVVHYAWRKAGGSDAGFQQAVASLLSAGLIALVPGPDHPLRLTGAGLQAVRAAVPAEADDGDEVGGDSEQRWQRAASAKARPLQERVDTLKAILAVLRLPVGHPVSATSMRRLWLLEGMRAGDLRDSLDELERRGLIELARHRHGTDIRLTEAGQAALDAG